MTVAVSTIWDRAVLLSTQIHDFWEQPVLRTHRKLLMRRKPVLVLEVERLRVLRISLT